ncbi:MAG: hypothetical protein AAB618_03720 [Patescibacteria group bacterium]
MKIFRSAATAALLFASTPALAQTVDCNFDRSGTANRMPDAVVAQLGDRKLSGAMLADGALGSINANASQLLASAPEACRQADTLKTAWLRLNGLEVGAQYGAEDLRGKVFHLVRYAPDATAPALSPTQPEVASAPSGGGAMLDAKIAELERRLASGNIDAETVRSIRAEMASLRTQLNNLRSQASVTKTVTIDRGPNPADKARWDKAAGQSASNTGVLEKLLTAVGGLQDQLFGKDNKSGTIGRLKATDADHEKRLGAAEAALLSWWTPQWWWFLVLLGLVLLASTGSRRGLARKADLDSKVDQSTFDELKTKVEKLDDRLTDTEDQVGKKIVAIATDLCVRLGFMKEGAEHIEPIVVDDMAYQVGLRKGAGCEVFIVSGIKGHTASNAVKIFHLIRTLRQAAYDGRLTDKVVV